MEESRNRPVWQGDYKRRFPLVQTKCVDTVQSPPHVCVQVSRIFSMQPQTNAPKRSTGRVDFITGKGTVRFYALPLASTRVAIAQMAKAANATPGAILDRLVAHALKTKFSPKGA